MYEHKRHSLGERSARGKCVNIIHISRVAGILCRGRTKRASLASKTESQHES